MKRAFVTCMFMLSLVALVLTGFPVAVNASSENVYDLSDVVESIEPGDESEMEFRLKKVGNKILNYGDSVSFGYKERAEKNSNGHFSRSAFGIGCYGFYFYHSNGDIQVKTCNLESDSASWERGDTVATITDGTFKTYEEIVLKTEIKTDDENIVVLSLTYLGKTITHDYAKDGSSDMLFRFGDHDVTGNFVKSLKETEKDTKPPVIMVLVDEFKVVIGAYPAEDAFTVTDDSGSCETVCVWSDGALDELGRLKAGRHYCTVTATDKSGNSSSAIIKYIVAISRKITFKADGKKIGEVEYFLDEIDDLTYSAVPQKQHYDGKWEEFTPSLTEDITVCAVYTPTEYSVIFKADDKIVATEKYTVENLSADEPQVPEKAGYTGKWESYNLSFEDEKIVNAEYEAITYTVRFVADGVIVAERVYTIENNKPEVPEVPEKNGYTGKWENYVLNYGDVTVNAVYVKTKTGGGCKSNVDGGSLVLMLGIALTVIAKKRNG